MLLMLILGGWHIHKDAPKHNTVIQIYISDYILQYIAPNLYQYQQEHILCNYTAAKLTQNMLWQQNVDMQYIPHSFIWKPLLRSDLSPTPSGWPLPVLKLKRWCNIDVVMSSILSHNSVFHYLLLSWLIQYNALLWHQTVCTSTNYYLSTYISCWWSPLWETCFMLLRSSV